MSKAKLYRTIRHAKKEQRLGENPRCEQCGKTDIRTLDLVDKRVLCAECRLRESGKPAIEYHHPAGKRNDSFSIPRPANDHADLSDAQYDWDKETLKNPMGDILHTIAAWLRAIHDTLLHLADKVEEWAGTLEALARYLAERLGADWWAHFQDWLSKSSEA